MIEVTAVSKEFDGVHALDNLEMHVRRGSIYGLIGLNGSGKTTALKIITGVLRPDSGKVLIGGANVFENPDIKRGIAFIPDDLYFFGSYSLNECANLYKRVYPKWDDALFANLKERFLLPDKRRLTRFSKGMRKQAAFILAMSVRPDYLILDEPIDGLDPLARKLVWKNIVDEVASREMTVLVSSHNLREMEGICDSVGIVDKGRILIERDLDELKSDIHKVQAAFPAGTPAQGRYDGLNVLDLQSLGTVDNLIVRSPREDVVRVVESLKPLVFDLLPLSLEEVFIYELGGVPDDVGNIIL
jgi:ABC-2 type transport system ATP-binding protein